MKLFKRKRGKQRLFLSIVVERRVRLELIFADIMRQNNVDLSHVEIREAVQEKADSFPGKEEVIFDFYRKK